MYVTIITEKSNSNFVSKSGLLDGLMDDFGDSIIEALSEDFKKKLKDVKCPVHNDLSKGTIIISLDNNDKPQIQKDQFCCKSFEKLII